MEPPPTTTRPFKPPIGKPPLVTPSASPPPLRHAATSLTRTQRQASWIESENHHDKSSRQSFITSANNNRSFGSVPPAKRAPSRAASTPKPGGAFSSSDGRLFRASSTSSFASGSSSKQNGGALPEEQIDIHQERQASIMRLLDAWSQLDKHVKRLDEDDIVHLGTGKIIKDKGVLRGLRTVKFGDHAEEEDVEDEEEDDEDVDEDEDEDQLDTLRSDDGDREEEDEELEIRVQAPTANMPPVTQTNPQDAEDLRAFLEVGKDIGTEPEDDPDDALDGVDEDTEGASSEAQDFLDQGEEEDETDGVAEELHESAPSGPEESDSEDELNCNWAEDEASVAIPVNMDETEVIEIDDEDDDQVIEIIEPLLPPTAKEPRDPSKLSNHKAQVQLYTPPLSRSSVQTPPEDDCATPPPAELPPTDMSPEIPIGLVYQPKIAPIHPFLSSPSSAKRKAKPGFPPPSIPHSDSSISHETVQKRDSTAVPEKKIKLKPEVVIERRTPFQEPKPSKKETKLSEPISRPASISSSGKSKEKGKNKREKPTVNLKPAENEVEKTAQFEKNSTQKSGKPSAKAKSTSASKESASKPKSKSIVPFPSSAKAGENVQPTERSPPSSPRKRKRTSSKKASTSQMSAVASSSKVQVDHDSEDEKVAESSKSSKDARRSVHQRSPRKSKSKSRSRQPSTDPESEDGGSHSDSDEDRRHYRHHSSRPGTYPPPPFHPYPFAHASMYPPPPQSASSAAPDPSGSTSHHHGVFPPVPPMPNHQTQYIVSQVMQQLTAMATGHWGPMPGIPPPPPHTQHHPPSSSPAPVQHPGYGHRPFTPTHQHQGHRRSKSKGPATTALSGYDYEAYGGISDPYSTPTHPHRHHHGGYPMYPYMFNPDMSRGTAPPDTPEHALDSSSPAMSNSDRVRKKSLVERSRSRGRRVSFKAGEGKKKSKGKARRSVEASSDEEDEEDEDRMDVFASSPLARRTKGSREDEDADCEDDGQSLPKKGNEKSKDNSGGHASRPRMSPVDVEVEPGKKKKGKRRICSPEEVEDSSEEQGDGRGNRATGSGDETSESDDIPLSRGRGFVRGQTPGPPVLSSGRSVSKSRPTRSSQS